MEVGLLGPITVSAPGPLEADRAPLATEVVVYLAAHPGGVHVNVLTGAVWPRGVPPEVRDAVLGRVAAWLGTDGSGNPNLVTDPSSGRLSLGPGVRADWAVFPALVARAGADGDEEACLRRALNLVRGQALDGHDTGRGTPGWPGHVRLHGARGDTAHRLSELRLGSGDPAGAMVAARAGLRLAFDDEALWRDLLLAAAAAARRRRSGRWWRRFPRGRRWTRCCRAWHRKRKPLIDELMPSWRNSAA